MLLDFNSIKVQLRHAYETVFFYFPALFQFHKGTIKTTAGGGLINANFIFQFHKGTIKTHNIANYALPQSHFNSIKVQLRLACCSNIISRYKFQFHKGTIKTTL